MYDLHFDEQNKKIIISSQTQCEWSCIVETGNLTLSDYHGHLPFNNKNFVEIGVVTYGTDEMYGSISCNFRNNAKNYKKNIQIAPTPLHIFKVSNTDIFLFGENTKTYVFTYYGYAQQNWADILKPLKIYIDNEVFYYNGEYSYFEIKYMNNNTLYSMSIQPYDNSMGCFEICFSSKTNFVFHDTIKIEGENENGNKQIILINLKQNKVENLPSVLKISPQFIFLNSDNPTQKINVTSLYKGSSCKYYISDIKPSVNPIENNMSDIEKYINGGNIIETIKDDNLNLEHLIKDYNATHFILDMSDAEQDDDNVDGDGNIAYELYVINEKDKTKYQKLEFFFDYIFDPDNYIQIDSAIGVFAYVYKNKDGIQIIEANNGVINFNDINNKDINNQSSITLIFIKKNSMTIEQIKDKGDDYEDYLFVEYDTRNNVEFKIKANPNWWQILTQSDYVKEVKIGDSLIVSLEEEIPNEETHFITLQNRLGKKCTIYVKSEGNIFEKNTYLFGLSRNEESKKPIPSLTLELNKPKYQNSTYLISESEIESIYNYEQTFEITSDADSISLNTLFYTYDENGDEILVEIKEYSFPILTDTNINKLYINYGSISKKIINNNEINEIKDTNHYYINNNELIVPIPFKTKFVPWTIYNNGTGIKYNIFANNNFTSLDNKFTYYPQKYSTKIEIIDVLPINLEDNTVYLIPNLKIDTVQDVSTVVFQQDYTLNESYLYLNRQSYESNKFNIDKIGDVASINQMINVETNNLIDILNENTNCVKIDVNDDEVKKLYYTSYSKLNAFTTQNNNNINFYTIKTGTWDYEKDGVGGIINNNNGILTIDGIEITDDWEFDYEFLTINGEKIFPQTGVTINDNENKIIFINNDNNSEYQIEITGEIKNKKVADFGKKYNVFTDDGGKQYIKDDCIYQVIDKSITLDDKTYILDDSNKFTYLNDGITYQSYEQDGKWFVNLSSKNFDIKYGDTKYYIEHLGEKIYLNDSMECEYNGTTYLPNIKINLKGLTLNVLENVDGETTNEKEKYIIINNTKYVATTNLGNSLYYEMVDLGLPSGLKWANKNVGAETDTDAGLYFQWAASTGNTEQYKDFKKETAPFYNEENKKFDKYNNNTLTKEDDSSNIIMGGMWRMPTKEECEELLKYCKKENIIKDNVLCAKLTGPNGNYLLFPVGAFRDSVSLDFTGGTIPFQNNSSINDIDFGGGINTGNTGNLGNLTGNTSNNTFKLLYTSLKSNIWTSSVDLENNNNAYALYCEKTYLVNDKFELESVGRWFALPIRGVGNNKIIKLSSEYELQITDNKITFDKDYFIDILIEPSHKYIMVDDTKYILNDNYVVYDSQKYELNTYNKKEEGIVKKVEYIVINNKGYKVYNETIKYYCIINNNRYDIVIDSLTNENINFINTVTEISENYYKIDEIFNETFKYELNLDNLLTENVISAKYIDNNNNEYIVTNGYVNISADTCLINQIKPIEKEFFVDMSIYPYKVDCYEFVSTNINENFSNNNCTLFFNDETEIIFHKNIEEYVKYKKGDSISLNDKEYDMTINDYSVIKFSSDKPLFLQIKNDGTIVYNDGETTKEVKVYKNETLLINNNITITFKDITRVNIFIKPEKISLCVFENVSIIDNEIYYATYVNNQKAITYDNNIYYVHNNKVNILDDVYEVYEKTIFFKNLIFINEDNYTKLYEVFNIENDISKTEGKENSVKTTDDYGYINNSNKVIFLPPKEYKDLQYTIHLPKYTENKTLTVISSKLENFETYNHEQKYNVITFKYDEENEVNIENGKFSFNISSYIIDDVINNEIVKQQQLIIFNNKIKTFKFNDSEVYSFWDYYENKYLKKVYKLTHKNIDLKIDKNITIKNIICNVDVKKHFKIDGNLYPIIKVSKLDLSTLTYGPKTINIENNGLSSTIIAKSATTITLQSIDIENSDGIKNIKFFEKEYTIIVNEEKIGNIGNIYKITYNFTEPYSMINGGDIISSTTNQYLDVVESVSLLDNKFNNDYYILYNDKLHKVINNTVTINKNINIFDVNNKLYAIYDIDNSLNQNMYVNISNEMLGNVKYLTIKNAISLKHNEIIIIQINRDDESKFGKYLITFN